MLILCIERLSSSFLQFVYSSSNILVVKTIRVAWSFFNSAWLIRRSCTNPFIFSVEWSFQTLSKACMSSNPTAITIPDIEDNRTCKNWSREVKINLKCIIVINTYFQFHARLFSSHLANIPDFEGLFEINMNELKIYLNICDKLILVAISNWQFNKIQICAFKLFAYRILNTPNFLPCKCLFNLRTK